MRLHALLLTVLLSACNDDAPAPAAPAAPVAPVAPAAPAAAEAGPFVPAPAGASVSFTSPADQATVPSPVQVTFAVAGMTVAPAGDMAPATGHHHLIIDGQPVPEGEIVPADDTHQHFGKGQVETALPLSPGGHTLTMQLADGMHRSYGPALSATIHVTVDREAAPPTP